MKLKPVALDSWEAGTRSEEGGLPLVSESKLEAHHPLLPVREAFLGAVRMATLGPPSRPQCLLQAWLQGTEVELGRYFPLL